MRNPLLSAVLFGALVSGCASNHRMPFYKLPEVRDLPFIHKIDIQQGNVLTQDMLGQLKKGMDKKKVVFIMGTPMVQDTFNSDRWDYVYTFQPGGGDVEARRVTLYFVDDKLDRVGGGVMPAEGEIEVTVHQDRTVDVPKQRKRSLVGRVADTIPFVGDKDDEQGKEKGKSGDSAKAPADKSVADKGNAADPSRNGTASLAESGKPPEVEVPEDPDAEKAKPAPKFNPYANIQAAPGEGEMAPPDAPGERKRFFGLFRGAGDSSAEAAPAAGDTTDAQDTADPRSISNPKR